jgi:hypothetical protein
MQSPCGLWFTQDTRNGGLPQVLTYNGTGGNFGETFVAFEQCSYNPSSDFNDALLVLQSVIPTPTTKTTWGSLKTLYR